MKRLITLGILGAIFMAALATAALATTNDGVCTGLDSGKIDTTGDPATVTVTAPEGMLISGYCVKAGSVNNGAGPVYVTVDPPQKSITFGYPDGKAVSHYAVSYVEVPTTTTVPDTTTTVPDTTTTVPEVTTTVPEVTTTVPEVTTTVPEVTTTVPEVTTTVPEVTTTDPAPTTTIPEVSTDIPEELPLTGGDMLPWALAGLAAISIGTLGILSTRASRLNN